MKCPRCNGYVDWNRQGREKLRLQCVVCDYSALKPVTELGNSYGIKPLKPRLVEIEEDIRD